MTTVRALFPSMLVAAGILAGTAVSAAAGSGWPALFGPALLVTALVAAALAHTRMDPEARGTLAAAAVLGTSILLASALVAGSDPGQVTELLPMLGATAGVVVLPRRRCRRAGRPAA